MLFPATLPPAPPAFVIAAAPTRDAQRAELLAALDALAATPAAMDPVVPAVLNTVLPGAGTWWLLRDNGEKSWWTTRVVLCSDALVFGAATFFTTAWAPAKTAANFVPGLIGVGVVHGLSGAITAALVGSLNHDMGEEFKQDVAKVRALVADPHLALKPTWLNDVAAIKDQLRAGQIAAANGSLLALQMDMRWGNAPPNP